MTYDALKFSQITVLQCVDEIPLCAPSEKLSSKDTCVLLNFLLETVIRSLGLEQNFGGKILELLYLREPRGWGNIELNQYLASCSPDSKIAKGIPRN